VIFPLLRVYAVFLLVYVHGLDAGVRAAPFSRFGSARLRSEFTDLFPVSFPDSRPVPFRFARSWFDLCSLLLVPVARVHRSAPPADSRSFCLVEQLAVWRSGTVSEVYRSLDSIYAVVMLFRAGARLVSPLGISFWIS
jgi:hypothetical protein